VRNQSVFGIAMTPADVFMTFKEVVPWFSQKPIATVYSTTGIGALDEARRGRFATLTTAISRQPAKVRW
jgi:hypothetical protein